MKRSLLLVLALVSLSGLSLAQRPGVAVDAEHITPLLPGQTVPDVTFKTVDGEDFNLRQEATRKPILLIFYRGGW